MKFKQLIILSSILLASTTYAKDECKAFTLEEYDSHYLTINKCNIRHNNQYRLFELTKEYKKTITYDKKYNYKPVDMQVTKIIADCSRTTYANYSQKVYYKHEHVKTIAEYDPWSQIVFNSFKTPSIGEWLETLIPIICEMKAG